MEVWAEHWWFRTPGALEQREGCRKRFADGGPNSARESPTVSAISTSATSSVALLSLSTSMDMAIAAASSSLSSTPSTSLASSSAMPTHDNSCPQTLRSYNSKLYDCIAQRNANEVGDIIAFEAYTIQQCVDACSNMNTIAGSVKCRAVAMTNGLNYEWEGNVAANCWLKSASQPSQQQDNTTLAVLITDGE